MNKAILIGRIGKTIELQQLPSETLFARCSLATSESYKDKESGDWQDATEWHHLVFWRTNAENASKVLQKGDLVSIEGNIKNRHWKDDNGIDRNMSEIHVHRFDKLVWKKSEIPTPQEPAI
ncbi:MAG: single-stranded DNA-binding protein [Aureispira sp.]|nr:single-stranded DNA-binding protein [Aureispira sp.]